MRVFLSWSGIESKQLAEIFKEWLPNVLQFVEPYMSAQDINLGERWNENITKNLSETDFGLIFVTPNNIKAPWINYEAGALSKTLDSRVIPILYKADVMILQEGPLKQFQSAKNLERESVLKLIKEINNTNKEISLDADRLTKSFNMWWPELEKMLNSIETESTNNSTESPDEKEILSMIIKKLNEQEKLLKDSPRVDLRKRALHPAFVKDFKKVLNVLLDCQVMCESIEGADELQNVLTDCTLNLKDMYNFLIHS